MVENVTPRDYPFISKCPPAYHLLSTYMQELGMISYDPHNNPVRSCKSYPLLQVEKLRHTEAGYIIPGHKTGETGSVGLDPGLWDP